MSGALPRFGNCEVMAREDIPVVGFEDFRRLILAAAEQHEVLSAFFGISAPGNRVKLIAVLANPRLGDLCALSTEVEDEYESLTPDCPQAHLFEREIAEQWGVVPKGHPWFKPVRFHSSYRPNADAWGRDKGKEILPSVTDFFQVTGEQVHEVAVGPVHAGVIEPGHFRFQCSGEEVMHLEISLGYQHRGIERLLSNCHGNLRIPLVETIAGDSTIAHTTAYCQAVESLMGISAPLRAEAIRGIALELERLANHTGDLGALAGDVGYLPTLSFCGRLRGDFLNITALLCGNRFGRGLVRPGGVTLDILQDRSNELRNRLDATFRDAENAVSLLWSTPSVLARFEETGRVTRETAEQLGLVGVAARGCGMHRDSRYDLPSGIFLTSQVPVATWHTGDVFARALVRWKEMEYSTQFIREQLSVLPDSELSKETNGMAPNSLVVSIVEGWRGEVCHVLLTNSAGNIEHTKVVDPSFHNWAGLAMSLRNQQISDFPLCNKSFNLSYCGHDL